MIYGAHTVAKALATATANSSIQGLRKLRRMARLAGAYVIEEKAVKNSEHRLNTFFQWSATCISGPSRSS